MCGIFGFWGDGFLLGASPESITAIMGGAIAQRGPDSWGLWQDKCCALGLGHRRLAIMDLSSEGHQPMVSLSGRWVVTYNGEIYNFEEIRREINVLGCVPWRGHSDTEVILAAIEQWGIRGALSRFVGMFALAIWDRDEQRLHLVRDRLGIKPIYYGWWKGALLFASTPAAIAAIPGFDAAIDRGALSRYLRHGCLPGTDSIYEGFERVEPGVMLSFDGASERPRHERFWDAREFARADVASRRPEQWLDDLEATLSLAVRQRMIADVPLGAFLSGGIDSSLVVALMCEHSSKPTKTFSIGFEDAAYDESSHARAVAEHLGTDHHEMIVGPAHVVDAIASLPDFYGEPFADSSQIPTLLVSKLARSQVTVTLSGDGGDELFAGYNRHVFLPRIWSALEPVPRPMRALAGRSIMQFSSHTWDKLFSLLNKLSSGVIPVRLPGDKLHKLARVMRARDVRDAYAELCSIWPDPEPLVIGARGLSRSPWGAPAMDEVDDLVAWLCLADLLGYMPDDVLTKVDRASMAVSLEARVPLLDHRVVELALGMPTSLKLRGGNSKWPLRQLLHRRVPSALFERPKMGFGIPLHDWLRGPLRPWAEALLDASRLRCEGYLEPGPVRRLWEAHLANEVNAQHRLWGVLMFQSWLERRP